MWLIHDVPHHTTKDASNISLNASIDTSQLLVMEEINISNISISFDQVATEPNQHAADLAVEQ